MSSLNGDRFSGHEYWPDLLQIKAEKFELFVQKY